MMQSDAPIATATHQEMDDESGQVEPDCLRVSLILRTILEHFSMRELLQLSLVNKFWSYEARSLLKDRASVALSINQKSPSCQDLRALAAALRRTKAITRVLPFSGLTISLNGLHWNNLIGLDCTHSTDCIRESTSTELSEVYDDLLSQMPWKSLSVEFGREWTEEFINCSGVLLVKKLVEKFGSVLEEVRLTFPSEQGDVFEQVFGTSSFPRLVTLQIETSYAPNNGYTNWIKTLVSRAPNLKLFESFNYVDLNANLLKGSSAVHVTDCMFSPLRNEIPESLVGKTFRMTRMDLTGVSQDFQLGRFNRILFGLLEASRTTLSLVHMDVMFLVPLAAYGICLENVTNLEIYLDHPVEDDPDADLLRLAKSFDFTRIFPNVKDVRIFFFSEFDYDVDGIEEMVELANASLVEPMPDRAVKIKKLSAECWFEIEDSGALLLAQMFPDVETLSMTGTDIPFGRIWESWPNLKALDVTYESEGSVLKNLDSVFCGIFPEEVAQLREQDEEYLRSVHIVPVMPSITGLKELQTLNFYFGLLPMDQVNHPTNLFSKVTRLIPFRRCPGLAVTLNTQEGTAPRYPREFTTVRLEY